MTVDRGAIFSTEAYALGKMLDHSDWNLPRRITPSDLDGIVMADGVAKMQPTIFDNAGSMIFCEFSRRKTQWRELDFGQVEVYRNILRMMRGRQVAVLCKHSVDPSWREPINTKYDIESFQQMFCHDGKIVVAPLIQSNARWIRFVEQEWFSSPFTSLVHRDAA